jgi:hypothetical protein
MCRDPSNSIEQQSEEEQSPNFILQSLCPYAEKDGYCEALETGRYCPYIHGDVCDLCEMPVLHPTNKNQQEQHRLVRLMNYIKYEFCFFVKRNVCENMKLIARKHLQHNVVKIKNVVFVLRQYGIEMAINVLGC